MVGSFTRDGASTGVSSIGGGTTSMRGDIAAVTAGGIVVGVIIKGVPSEVFT